MAKKYVNYRVGGSPHNVNEDYAVWTNDLLKRKGLLALEIGHSQYKKVSNILKENGYREMSKEYDFKHNVRCIISTKVKFY